MQAHRLKERDIRGQAAVPTAVMPPPAAEAATALPQIQPPEEVISLLSDEDEEEQVCGRVWVGGGAWGCVGMCG